MSSVGIGAVLVSAATNNSGVAVSCTNGALVGVGRMVPVGVGKTGWKGVGVGCNAGWKGVEVGLAFGLTVTSVKACAEDAVPQAELNKVSAMRMKRTTARRLENFIGLCPT